MRAEGGIVSTSVVIGHENGLHARPAVKFTKLAKTFLDTAIRIRGGDELLWTDAKSIVKVMALKLRSGTMLQIEAEGEGAEAAVTALKGLVQRHFDEADGG